jgi:hypothetical protein
MGYESTAGGMGYEPEVRSNPSFRQPENRPTTS